MTPDAVDAAPLNEEPDSGRKLVGGTISNDLSAQRTAMSFERTAMASDRTLMASVRTSLALIGFGFTIFQFFHKLSDTFLAQGLPSEAPRRFGLGLIVLGVLLLVLGIINHFRDVKAHRRRQQALIDDGLLQDLQIAQPKSTAIVAALLLVVGILAMLRVGLNAGPF